MKSAYSIAKRDVLEDLKSQGKYTRAEIQAYLREIFCDSTIRLNEELNLDE